jgi:hypothetical protein
MTNESTIKTKNKSKNKSSDFKNGYKAKPASKRKIDQKGVKQAKSKNEC